MTKGKLPAYEVVAAEIRQRILSGEFAPGERLPSEAELIESSGNSRSTIREAMRTLASENLVYTTRGTTGGTFVASPDVAAITSHLENSVTLMAAALSVTVEQLMDVRQLTEVHAAGRAAHHRTEEQMATMRRSVDSAALETDYAGHQDFHMQILHASGNPMLELVCAPVFRVLSRRFVADRAAADFWEASQAEHRAIMAAIESQDSLTAMSLMQRHLHRIEDAYKEMELLTSPVS
ncbi:FadR/GntR family transcriptional regulator [Aeromicrobium wangtongii]|uniref:FCD domain-containing protein n=1 Tax=Aeromicrobium wangtongii TaxID=2969247 RepID=A0ABY5MDZ0_9ACTN|nr:GntR family transcriptional regulator [Aeromicrobium wangtongii]MCD9197752.1 FCD domain-containing protein [Aeromicrobium wangtongii]UUP15235.1 FCD domain-containing protein [Aeromicrobium wangtongii]